MNMQAEKLFKEYCGSHFQMARNNVLEDYQKFNISIEVEEKWRAELFEDAASIFEKTLVANDHFDNMADLVQGGKTLKLFYIFIDIIKKVFNIPDSFTKIRICEEIVRILEYGKNTNRYNTDMMDDLKNLFRDILLSIDEENFTVNQYYHSLPYMKGLLDDEHLKERVNGLKEISKNLA